MFGFLNCDLFCDIFSVMTTYQAMLEMIESNYPEIMKAVFIVNGKNVKYV